MKLNALLMAGGKGTRLRIKGEKPLLVFKGRYMIDHVLEALRGSKYVAKIIVATSRDTRRTEKEMRERGIEVIRTPGEDYVKDMVFAIKKLKLEKTLVVSSDLPLLTSKDIDYVIEEYVKKGNASLAVMVPREVFRKHKLTPTLVIGDYVPTGVNVVNGRRLDGKEAKLITERFEFAANVNSSEDLKRIESIK